MKESEFDFDYRFELSREDRGAFERVREEVIEREIVRLVDARNGSVDLERKLMGLQFKLDMMRCQSKTPMSAHLKISRMFYEQLFGRRGFYGAICSDATALEIHSSRQAADSSSDDKIIFLKLNESR